MTGRVKSARCLTDFPKNLWKGLQDISCDSRGWTRWPRTSSLLQCSQTCPMFIHAQNRGWPSRSFRSMYVYICGHALTRLQLASYPWLGNFGLRPALRFLCFVFFFLGHTSRLKLPRGLFHWVLTLCLNHAGGLSEVAAACSVADPSSNCTEMLVVIRGE